MIGTRIKQLRKENKMTQADLGDKLGVIKQTISSWENGISSPGNDAVREMATIFGVSTDYLLGKTSVGFSDDHAFFKFTSILQDVFTLRFKKAMEARSYSMEDFEEHSHFPQQKCMAYASGEWEPSLEDLITISQVLNVTTDYLLGQVDFQVDKAFSGLKQLSEDNKDIIIGEIKKLIKEQKSESVAADEPLRAAVGK